MSRATQRPRAVYKAWRTVSSRWSDNDSYRHINNVVFYEWFDTAVNVWLVEHGVLDIENGNPIGLVVETRCAYFAPLSFPQAVEVGIALKRLGTSSVTYSIGIFAEGEEEAAAQGEFTHVYVDRDTRRPMPLPNDWRHKLESLR